MGSEFKTECMTKENQKVEIFYNEQTNTWDFRINKRMRSRQSLTEAKQVVMNYQTDDRVKREKVKFEKFKAVRVAALPYRLGHMNNVLGVDDVRQDVDVVGLKENNIGSGKFDIVTVSRDGNNIMLNLRVTARDKTFVFKNPDNLNAVTEVVEETNKLYRLKEIEDKKIEELQAGINKHQGVIHQYEKQFDVKKREFVEKLKVIEMMDEFDWNVMSTRETRQQNGAVNVSEE